MLSTMLRTIKEHTLVAAGDRVLVAVSGGPDSTALLHGLLVLAPRLGLTLEAAVVDHGLRPESTAEAAEVLERCRAAGVGCAVLQVDVRAARGRHVSWQDAARRARLGALEGEARRLGCPRVALGHTADDQAETLLFRIVRGTGVVGLAGIPYQRDPFVRPLLDVRRREVLAYLRRRRLPFIEDPSNADGRFARARVRHEWIPALERENPRLVEALLALGADARRALAGMPPAAARAEGWSRRAAATVARLAAERAGTRTVAVRGGSVEVSYGRVQLRALPSGTRRRVTAAVSEEVVARRAATVTEIAATGTYQIGSGEALQVIFGTGPPPDPGAAPAFDLDRLALPLGLRALRPGDRMRPRGGRGTRKLSDLLIDAKVPRPRRAGLPVLVAADGTVLFVPGVRPAEAGRPDVRTTRWIQVRPQ